MRFGLSEQFEATIERIKRNSVQIASPMQCPCHQKKPWVQVDGETLDDLEVEVFTCCDKFLKRVREALTDIP